MLKRIVSCLIPAFCALFLAFGLSACGPDYTENFAGTWYVTEMQDSTGADLTPVIEQLNAANKRMELTLSAEKDKTATFDLAGQTTLEGTWKVVDENACALNFDGYDEIRATLSDGLLTFEEGGQTMVCQRQG